jgi:hypothetical protein
VFCAADALIRHPRVGSTVVGKSGRAFKLIFRRIQNKVSPLVFFANRKRIEWNGDVFLVEAQEAADAYHRGNTIGPKPKCHDVRDLVAIGWKADTTRTSQK